MAIKSNTFEGGTDGTNVVPVSSGGASGDAFDFLFINGGSVPAGSSAVKYTAAAAVVGSLGCEMTPAAGATFPRWDSTDTGTRFVMRRTFVPLATSADTEFMTMRSTANAVMASVKVDTALKPYFTRGTAPITASKPASGLTAGTAYYAELAVTLESGPSAGDGVVEFRILATDGTVLHTYQLTGQATGTTIAGQYRMGGVTTASGWAKDKMDAPKAGVQATGWFGAAAATPPVAVASLVDNIAIIDATASTVASGTITYSVAQLSGPTITPTLLAAGVWSVPKHATTARVYRVTTSGSGGGADTEDVTVPPIPAGGATIPTIRRYRRAGGVFV